MMRVAVAALLGLALVGHAQHPPLTAEELYERVAPSVWMVQVRTAEGSGVGSGVVVAPETLITNCHVVDKATQMVVRHGRRVLPATLRHKDPSRDLCELDVPGLNSPAVPIGDWHALRVGAKLYALGNPRGLELTLSDGLLSSIRRGARGEIEALQISVPISPGSSGGGLFDVHGRLMGITTSGIPTAQNIGFALPATWIAELRPRAGVREALAGLVVAPDPPAAPARPVAPLAPAATVAASAPPPPAAQAPRPEVRPARPLPPQSTPEVADAGPTVFEYELRDRITGLKRPVVYRVERRDGGVLVFNGGSRIEEPGGKVVALTQAIAGEFEQAMPPGGWPWEQGTRLPGRYESMGDSRPYTMELQLQPIGPEVLRIAGTDVRTQRMQFTGYTSRGGGFTNNPGGRYQATVWYAPELDRVVRFEARTRGGLGMTSFVVDEVLELVDMRSH